MLLGDREDAQRVFLEKAGLATSFEGASSGIAPTTGNTALSIDSTSQAHTAPEDFFLLCAEVSVCCHLEAGLMDEFPRHQLSQADCSSHWRAGGETDSVHKTSADSTAD